ncbi:VOC family protein [Fictibacillus enclensis]|uniref:VOC family protein n=1 Tax=Fictibacillus enclensis TaxID=1017270 RepID=UPI0025A094E9|nr:VOC family protein [Fictibacillus enclensis]MDM5340937.1 VOC family protein [Fictibacillus enclensis]
MEAVIHKVGQIGVPVKDLKRAITFYQEKLRLNLLFQTDNMAFFECNGLRLLLDLPENEAFEHPSSVIYFQVADIQKAHQEMADQDVSFISEPHLIARMGRTETWMAFFTDTEGNTHALMSEFDV